MNGKKLWFKNKRYGWGWYPASREGWAVLLVWVLFFILGEIVFLRSMQTSPSNTAVVGFVVYVTLTLSVLLRICYLRGEKPRFRWGDEEK